MRIFFSETILGIFFSETTISQFLSKMLSVLPLSLSLSLHLAPTDLESMKGQLGKPVNGDSQLQSNASKSKLENITLLLFVVATTIDTVPNFG